MDITPKSFLEKQVNLLERLFDDMPMGIAVLNREMQLVRFNPTWAEFIDRYTPSHIEDVLPGKSLFELAPDADEFFMPIIEQVLAGETIRLDSMRSVSGGIESFWDVVFSPLYENDQVIGILDVTTDATERVQLYRSLENRVEERTRELSRRQEIAESMRDIVSMINSRMPLEAFLERAVELATQRMEASACTLQKFDFLNEQLILVASYNMPGDFKKGFIRPFSEMTMPGTVEYLKVIAKGKPTYGNYPPYPERVKIVEDDDSIPEELKIQRLAIREAFAGSLAVPLTVQGEVFGGMVFYYDQEQDFQDEQVKLALTFADQVALAVENANLHEQAEQAAAAQERSRLARDLHDAVTQTLFSASLIAEVIPRIWERDPEAGRQRIDELRQLTRGALSEMRTLLMELRPAALLETPLPDLIQHLVNAFLARTRVPIEYRHTGETELPETVKEAFYRIAQEALNNIAKHAGASHVELDLNLQTDQAQLVIKDNGIGFDLQTAASGQFGLGIMRERAESVAAEFLIESYIHKGTRITVNWKGILHE